MTNFLNIINQFRKNVTYFEKCHYLISKTINYQFRKKCKIL